MVAAQPPPKQRRWWLYGGACGLLLLLVGVVVMVVTGRSSKQNASTPSVPSNSTVWPSTAGIILTRSSLSTLCSEALTRTSTAVYQCLEKCTKTYTMFLSVDGAFFKVVPPNVTVFYGKGCACWPGYGKYIKGSQMTITFPSGVSDPISDGPNYHATDTNAYPALYQSALLTPLSCNTVQVSVTYSGNGNMPNPQYPIPPRVLSCTGTFDATLPSGFGCI